MTFSAWITSLFDHPVTNPEWYWEEDHAPRLSHRQVVAYMRRTFAEADTLLEPYTDAQVNQGLWMLISGSDSNWISLLRKASVPLPERLACIAAMETLFAGCLARRCTPHLSHRDTADLGTPAHVSALNGICYMWWDILPIQGLNVHAPKHRDSAEIDRACLRVMRQTLEVESLACRESALHGLGHWSLYYSEASGIINDFLIRHPNLPLELQGYAEAAREGCIQ